MTPPRWIIPLEPGEPTGDTPRIVVTVDEDLQVDIETENCAEPFVWLFTPLVACRLGQELQDASRWCGQERAKREAKGRK